jgi:hypothetical protein
MRKFQELFEQLRGVVEWLRCLPFVLYLGGASPCRVNQSSVVQEYGVDGSRDGERGMKRIRKTKKKTEKEENVKTTKRQNISERS